MRKYFSNINSLEDLRKQYRDLLKKFHPDNPGGSEEVCKAVNTEYESVFADLKAGRKATVEPQAAESMKWDSAEDAALREKLRDVVRMSGINVTIVGNWIWIDGNTFPHKSDLKAAGFKWASTKKMWYWHSETYRKRSKRKLSFAEICDLYGSAKVETERQAALA